MKVGILYIGIGNYTLLWEDFLNLQRSICSRMLINSIFCLQIKNCLYLSLSLFIIKRPRWI